MTHLYRSPGLLLFDQYMLYPPLFELEIVKYCNYNPILALLATL